MAWFKRKKPEPVDQRRIPDGEFAVVGAFSVDGHVHLKLAPKFKTSEIGPGEYLTIEVFPCLVQYGLSAGSPSSFARILTP